MLNYTLTVSTPPDEEPVSLDEIKSHLRLLDNADEDGDLSLFISSARLMFEHLTDGRIVLPTEYTQQFECWPTGCYCPRRSWLVWPFTSLVYLPLACGNVTAVDSVTYFDQADEEQDLEVWSVDLTGTPAVIYLPGNGYPSLSTLRPRPIVVTYTAGWADLDAVPSAVKLAIKLLAGHYYNARESHSEVDYKDVPLGFRNLCQLYSTGMNTA